MPKILKRTTLVAKLKWK